MKEKRIFLKPDEIQAILDNRKSMFRVVIPREFKPSFGKEELRLWTTIDYINDPNEDALLATENYVADGKRRVYYELQYPVGTFLRCAEPWRVIECIGEGFLGNRYKIVIEFKPEWFFGSWINEEQFNKYRDKKYRSWQSPAHMPKDFARIWLKVTGNKVERLQEISYNDALKEGIKYSDYQDAVLDDFVDLWDSTHAKHKWESNPCVECPSFERIEK